MTRVPIFFDLRPLQDVNFKSRGVGFLITCLLRARAVTQASDNKLVGLIDPDCEDIPPEYTLLVDDICGSWNPIVAAKGAIFVSGSPMTHEPTLAMRFSSHRRIVTAAVVYDFIPLDRPGYFTHVSSEMDYFARLAHLRQYDLFLPISAYAAKRLTELLGTSPESTNIIGAPVRREFCAERDRLRAARVNTHAGIPYFLCVGGGDRRKNVEAAVRAVRTLRTLVPEPVDLKLVGNYGEDYRRDLLACASAEGADPSFLKFYAAVDDADLAALYMGAFATIAPSHIEGFSLPVVESAVCGSPVIASMCAAHLELIDQPEALFPSYDVEELTNRLLAVWTNPALREALVSHQAPLAGRFQEDVVGGCFWDFVMSRASQLLNSSGPIPLRRARPRFAFLTPYPPDRSGVARFSELTLRSLSRHADVSLYSNAPRPLDIPEGVSDAGPVSPAVMRRGPYDSVISVLGNSHFHIPMFEIMEKFGGPCILHDSRLTQIYYARFGDAKFREWASALTGHAVCDEDIRAWLHDQRLPSLFIEPIIGRAAPLIVHTPRFRDLLRERYQIEASVAAFPPNTEFLDEELLPAARVETRRRLGIAEDVFAIATFGELAFNKGLSQLLVALDLLRCWKIPAKLFLVGNCQYLREHLEQIACEFRISDHIQMFDYVDTARYRDYLIAVDAAVQLRTYDYGQLSAALVDCISAGLPAVTNQSLADSCEAPSYVLRVHDHISPLRVAERLAEIWETLRCCRPLVQPERRQYCCEHSFDQYAIKLMAALGFE